MEKCDFCLYREGCIGDVPGPDGSCLAFVVPLDQQVAYERFLAEKAHKAIFSALCGDC